jgi:transcriptional regulator with XRE-family HTH domain
MPVSKPTAVASYFGSQVCKERIKNNLNVAQLARITGIDDGHLGRIEKGLRNPTPDIARRLDAAFPKREGHFMDLYLASQSWVPAEFRRWSEYEDPSRHLWVWSPYTIDGFLQTGRYARALLETAHLVPEALSGRLKSRMDRQQRILYRDDPPHVWFVVDVLSLLREVGGPEVMAEQLAHLAEVAALPHVTMTVMPATAHDSNESGFVIADGAVYAEHVANGGVYQAETLDALTVKFATLQGESYRVAESARIVRTLEETWRRGENPLTAVLTAASA